MAASIRAASRTHLSKLIDPAHSAWMALSPLTPCLCSWAYLTGLYLPLLARRCSARAPLLTTLLPCLPLCLVPFLAASLPPARHCALRSRCPHESEVGRLADDPCMEWRA